MRALLLLVGALLMAAPAVAAPRSHPVIAGSSTVFPFAVAVAERWQGTGPLVLPMGSGAGIAWFCEGLGPATPDIALASREMTAEEASGCRIRGVTPVERSHLGYDGIVLATSLGGKIQELPLAHLWHALAARVPDPAGRATWVDNPYHLWSDLDPELPATPIRILGPPATSGTRDAFVALALKPACDAALRQSPQGAPDSRRCGELRRDGAWQEAGENDDALVARLGADPEALGVVGFGALVRNRGRVSAVCLDGNCATADKIAAGEYPLSRPLYLYLKPAHRAFIPGLDALVAEFFNSEARAPEGFLVQLGLVPAETALATPATPVPEGDLTRQGLAARLLTLALLCVLVALAAGAVLMRRARPRPRGVERLVTLTLWASASLTAALLAVVLATLVLPTVGFFLQVSPVAFLGGTHWSPESAIRASQAVGEGAFGVLPVLLGSGMVAAIAVLVALPLALAGALHGYAWAGRHQREAWQTGIRLAALLPAVVYGLFAVVTVAPMVAGLVRSLGLAASIENTLAAGLVVGIMLLPVLVVRIEEALAAVPSASATAALGLGATRWEVLRDIVLPSAAPGIGAALLLAVARALGETMIVLMAAGLVAAWTLDPLAATTTLTAEMVKLMTGTHALDNVRTQLPFVLGLLLAIIVLPLNAWALRILRRANVVTSPVF
jgi:phosphate transport system substrate-binding protein